MKKEHSFTVVIEPCEEGGYFGACPAMSGCHAQGETYEETLSELKGVIQAMLEDCRDDVDAGNAGEVVVTTVRVMV